MKILPPKNFPIVLAGLEKLDEKLLIAGEKGLKLGLDLTQTMVMRQFLSGPRSKTRLDAISGRLRGSIAISVQRSGKGVIGRIGSNMKYARYHEFGFHGSVQVRAHVRHVLDANRTGEGRRSKDIRDRAGNVIGRKRESVDSAKKRGVNFVKQQVGAHLRKINYAGRPFIKPALVKTQGTIKEFILEELKKVRP